MRRTLALGMLLAVWPGLAVAAGWGGIEPGVTTSVQVRERYGAPTKEQREKVEGYDTTEWVYEGEQAPTGMLRMVVGFGLLTPSGYQPDLVRVLRLTPKPRIFGRLTVLEGWGAPDAAAREEGRDVFFYSKGLIVTFDEDGRDAASMIFAPPQPDEAPRGPGRPETPGPAVPAQPAEPRR